MTTANDVLKIAASQIGVCESPAGSNKTKYGKEFGMNGQPWCSIFLWWCFNHAKAGKLYPHNANAAYAQDEIVSKCGGAWVMKKNTRKDSRKAYLKNAKAGDIVTFDFGAMDGYRRHIGIVESVSGDYLICIEGNTSQRGSQSNGGMVCRQRRIYTSICVAARPAYTGETAKVDTKPATTKKPVKTQNKASKTPTYTKGKTYTVDVDNLNVRTGAGVKYKAKTKKQLTKDGQKHANSRGQLMKGTRVTCQGVNKNNGNVWIKIPSGWICAYYQGKQYVK